MKPNRIIAVGILATGLTVAFGQAAASDDTVAKVSRVEGNTLVNQGAEYVPASDGLPLREGDLVMAMEGGSATITFSDGCVYKLDENMILTVGAADSCTRGLFSLSQANPFPAATGLTTGAAFAGLTGLIIAGAAIAGSDDVRIDRPRPPSP